MRFEEHTDPGSGSREMSDAATVVEREATEPARGQLVELARGATLGRYVVLEPLGAGGMGVVYAAYDPQLDRKVALKLMQLRSDTPSHSSGVHGRLLREAQAMARLSHPNVVTVHDVGLLDKQLFLAMEFVDGSTLTDWMEQSPRSWPEVLRIFRAAALGLAAAHDADLVHRDFKPDNLMIGRDGRVRVMDFGLARAAVGRDESGTELDDATESLSHDSLSERLTATGALMGTPAYMAPELLEGGDSNPRTDQFSFMVAFYRALYGERPFAGDSLPALAANVVQGRVRPPARDAKVPNWLRRVLVRGLSVEPDQRFVSMHEVIAAISRDPGQRRRRILLVGGAAVLVAGGIAANNRIGSTCQGAAEKLHGVWDPPRRRAVEQAFLASELPYAASTWAAVGATLDDYAGAWVVMHRSACEATRVHGEQSDTMLDLRMVCLGRRLEELAALTEIFAEADVDVVNRSVRAASGLPGLAACADLEQLSASYPPPDDAARESVEAIASQLSRVRALGHAGRYADALALVEPLAEQAAQLDYRPIRAEVLFQLGVLQLDTGDPPQAKATLDEAAFQAEAGRHDEVAARAWTVLTYVEGHRLAHRDAGHAASRRAEAAVLRGGNRPDLMANVLLNRGTVFLMDGKPREAHANHERALELRTAALGPDHFETGKAHVSVGNALFELGQYDEALEHYRIALEISERKLGPDHPDTGQAIHNLGTQLVMMDRHEEGQKQLERSLQVFENALGKEHPQVAMNVYNLGWAAEGQKDYPRALELFERAMAIETPLVGEEHPVTGEYLASIGNVLYRLERYEEAISNMERARAILANAHGPRHPRVGRVLNDLALVASRQGRLEDALRGHREVLALRLEVLGEGHPEVTQTLDSLASVLEKLGRYEEAISHLLHRRELLERHPSPDEAKIQDAEQHALELAQKANR